MARPVAETILVVHLAGIGDLLMGLPALQALRAAFPASRIALLTWAKSQDVAQLIQAIDEHYTLEERSSWRALSWNLATIRRLHARRFDLAMNLYQVYRWIGVTKLALLLRLIAATRTAGRDTDGKGFCFDLKVPERSSDPLHEVERQLALTEHLGCPRTDTAASLALDPGDQQTVEQWLTRLGVKPDTLLIGIHPGGARASHRWPWGSFARIARELETRYAARIVLTGDSHERGIVERIASELAQPLVAAGKFSLGQLACVLRRCRVFITNDCGPMHLAATLKVPLVAIAGPMAPERYGPYPLNRADQVILHADGCRPCYHKSCDGHEALERLPVGVVLETVEAILNGRHPSGLHRVAERVRVLHLHTLPIISGSGINTFLSMQGLPTDRYEVELGCAPGGPLLELVEQHGMVVRRLTHMVWPIRPLRDLLVIGELWRLMRRQRYTIVHTHNSKAGFVGRLAARLAGVPVVIHTVHGFAFHSSERRWRRQLYRLLERLAAQWCDRLIMISQPLLDWSFKERIAPREKMTKIYSGIDLQAFHAPVDQQGVRAALGLQADDFIVGEVAKLWPGKGHEVLLCAAATLAPNVPSLKLLIVGEGGLRSSLERLAEELDIRERIVFTGFRADVPALTQVLDVAVLPTSFEGMGRAVIEAQAASKPVIASKVGGIPDLITDGMTGLLVEPGNIEQLASAIRRLYERPQLRRQLGQAARAAADERFASQTMVQQILTLYDELLTAKVGARSEKPRREVVSPLASGRS